MTDPRIVWNELAASKTPERAAWDDDRQDETDRHVDVIDGELDWDDPERPTVDFGCGPGRLLIPLARRHRHHQFVGIDVSPAMVAPLFDWRPANVDIVFRERPGEWAPERGFANIYSMLTFQHMDDGALIGAVESLAPTLKLGGRFVAQFVDDPDPDAAGPLSFPRPWHTVTDLIGDLFDWMTIKPDPVEPSWFWFIGVR